MKIDLGIMAKAAASVLLKQADLTTVARKSNPTQHIGRAVEAIGGVRKAVATGAPVRGSAEVLEHLMHAPASALGFVGKHAGLDTREYMRRGAEAAGGAASGSAAGGLVDKLTKHMTAQNALRYGLPAVYGGLYGAELVPENRVVGALGGAGGAVGGAELGGIAGRSTAQMLNAGPLGETIGSLLGRLVGAGMGQDIGTRGARLLVT